MCSPDLSGRLTNAGWVVELHNAMFADEGETDDHKWIPIVAERGYTILTSDKRIRYLRTEGGLAHKAIVKSAAKIFVLRGVEAHEQAGAVIAAEREICRYVKRYAGTHLIARIHSTGLHVGEITLVECGKGTRTELKYGARLNQAT